MAQTARYSTHIGSTWTVRWQVRDTHPTHPVSERSRVEVANPVAPLHLGPGSAAT